MKKKLTTAIILSMFCLSTTTFAQSNRSGSETRSETARPDTIPAKSEKDHFEFLLNLVSTNLNYGKANSSLASNKKSVFGAQVGLSYHKCITRKISLVSEFYFMMKGGKLVADNSSDIQNTTLRLYTLESPVLIRYYFGDFYVNAGPSIAYNFYGTRKIEDTSTKLSFNNSSDGFQRWDAGVQVGAGYKFHIKQTKIGLDVRYSYGLSNISYGQEMHNRYLNIGLHFSKQR